MATYALTFATRAAFDTSLASGDIYNLMQGVTSSKPSVAITATITESGETFACGTNVMVDIKSVGPGDYVMYDSTNNKFFGIASKWIDNRLHDQPTQHIMIFKEGVLPARYVVCGTTIKRFGNRIRIAGVSNQTLPWTINQQSGYDWTVWDIPRTNFILKKNGLQSSTVNPFPTLAWCSMRYLEHIYGNGSTSYFPITRSEWNAAVIAGDATVTARGKTVTLADYNWSFDYYIEQNYAAKWPASSGLYTDKNGADNTRKIVAEFIANHEKTESSDDYAAGYCYNYAINAPGLGKHQWFLGVIKDMNEVKAISYTLILPLAFGSGYVWSSSQYLDTSGAWDVGPNGMTGRDNKYYRFYAIPLADLILEN